MRSFKVLLFLIALILRHISISATPSYLGCFLDCISGGGCANGLNQYINGRETQLYAAYSVVNMTNEFCIEKCTSLNTFIYAATTAG